MKILYEVLFDRCIVYIWNPQSYWGAVTNNTLSLLNERKFKHNFCDFIHPLCACNLEPETTPHYLRRCHLFQTERRTLLNDTKQIDENIITDNKNDLDQIFLYGNGRCKYDTNRMILLSTIKFCIDSKRFDFSLF